ncbi:hypothetical protein [Nocardia sp. NBC_01327]|uniref:hypothetical protein n=1 Tax=Nocardia sp. NBC_01327 TaxID=2903593 RepID=UPI002E0D5C41|nr:hypothetical protein OG326_30835 [Nocardia sp. NBC_01327]
MTDTQRESTAVDDTAWFGRSSFHAATVVTVLTAAPILILVYTAALCAVLAAIELLTALYLMISPGTSRQVGVGILFGLIGSVIAVGTYLIITITLA